MNDTARDRVLCVEHDARVLEELRRQLSPRYELIATSSAAEALQVLRRDPEVSAILSELRLPGSMDGASFLAHTRELAPSAGRVLLSAQHELQTAIAAVNAAQVLRFLAKPCRRGELQGAVEAAVEHHRLSTIENTKLRRALTAQISSQDPLTGLAGRARFLEILESVCADADDRDRSGGFAVMLLQLENMRDIQVTDNEATVEQLVRSLSQRLAEQCSGALCLARWSEDQFAILTPGDFDDDTGLLGIAEALIRQCAQPIVLPAVRHRVRAHVGIAGVPAHTGDARTAVKFAEIALGQARLQGGGIACLFRSDWAQRVAYRQQLLSALREALDRDALHVHYQPVVDLKHGTVPVLEALARWTHPTLGPVAPAQFIALAEESGEMPRLGDWILRRVCRDARSLVGRYCARVAVNVSVHQLLHEGFIEHLDRSLRQAGLRPQELEVELTESVLASDAERSLALLTQLRRRGVAIAIDDFGTGYSSLSYLQRFPADVIKVDRSFVASLGGGGETIISAALSIGRSFGMQVVIEGVETELARRQLTALGATLFQGYLYARPMSIAGVDQWFLGSAFAAAPSEVPEADESQNAPPPGLTARAR